MMIRTHHFVILIWLFAYLQSVTAQSPWDKQTYPDESGFSQRMAPMLVRISEKGYGERSKAESECPDTGLPVRSWALEGETIISPYTGRAYIQGPTGYFGPKARNKHGEIIAFGGDPLKYDLPPATAALLLNPSDSKARAFLSIPGNLRQQYHFACKNWARFYPLLHEIMGEEWNKEFQKWVGVYTESRRPSDGARELLPLSNAHNLVGEQGELLGGNPKDGGTENHKTMWRTSALVYSQLFPDTEKISGYTASAAKSLVVNMLREYLEQLLLTGNGEYDSQVYYPHTIEAFMNLYDFSTDAEIKQLAKFALDYYFSTYGLKVVNGAIAGAQKRGYLTGHDPGEMEIMLWGYFNDTSRDMSKAVASIQQATTTYRPNKIIWDIVRKDIPLPFEAKMSRPFYHMDYAHAFAETFYASRSYAMGNIQMTIVDNPNQQMVWSVVARSDGGPLCFSGGHPMRKSTSGHSPYTQTLQSKGTLMLITAPTKKLESPDTTIAPNYSKTNRPNLWHLPASEQQSRFEIRHRQKYGQAELGPMILPASDSAKSVNDFFYNSMRTAGSWFYYPNPLQPVQSGGIWLFDAGNTFLAVIPLTEKSFNIHPGPELAAEMDKQASRFFTDYSILVFPGTVSGYIVETGERDQYGTLSNFGSMIKKKTTLDKSKLKSQRLLQYRSLFGHNLLMQYNSVGLRCQATLDGEPIDWDHFTEGRVYQSPYITVGKGKLKISNGTDGYQVEFKNGIPVYSRICSYPE
ncbi:hypothetical protein GF406_22970 [candidate division KSB1 bacterium]|nr:hypothetical protein [candidate division KSB1 bacterium]